MDEDVLKEQREFKWILEERSLHILPTLTPYFSNNYTKMTAAWQNWQRGPCADYEYEFALCDARVGRREVKKACKIFHDNFMECSRKYKTRERYMAMQAERKRQNKPFMPPPEMDSIRMWWRMDD